MEQMQYNLLFRWFVGLGIDDPVWVPTVFTKNRDRLLTTEMSRKVLAAILAHRDVAPLLSDEHFSVDGTLIKAWASMKSFQPKPEGTPPDAGPGDPPGSARDEHQPDQPEAETSPMTRRDRNAEVDFRGQRRTNATHASTSDPDARLFRKSQGTGAVLCFMGHTLMENNEIRPPLSNDIRNWTLCAVGNWTSSGFIRVQGLWAPLRPSAEGRSGAFRAGGSCRRGW